MKNKRRISKVLALVLEFALLLGMSRPAAAEIVENPEDMDIYTIKKTFQIENEGTTTPEETFEDGKASVPLTIRHGQTIIIENLPYGVMWEVAEADYTGEGYSITINELPMFIEGNEVNFVSNLVEELADVFILNHREQDVETGVILENLPYVTIVVLVTGGLVGFVFKKRVLI